MHCRLALPCFFSALAVRASSPEFSFAPLLIVLVVPVIVLPFGLMLDKTAPANRGAATFDDSSLNAVMRPARCIVQVGHLLVCAVAFLMCLGPADTSEALAPPSAMMSIWVRNQLLMRGAARRPRTPTPLTTHTTTRCRPFLPRAGLVRAQWRCVCGVGVRNADRLVGVLD